MKKILEIIGVSVLSLAMGTGLGHAGAFTLDGDLGKSLQAIQAKSKSFGKKYKEKRDMKKGENGGGSGARGVPSRRLSEDTGCVKRAEKKSPLNKNKAKKLK